MAAPFPPGGQPIPQLTPQQMQAMQQKFLQDAAAAGVSPQEYAARLRAMAQQQAMARAQQMQQQQQQGGGQPQPLQGGAPPGEGQPQQQQGQPQQQPPQGQPQMQQMPMQQRIDGNAPPNPAGIAVAKFLRGQNLKSRPCILQEKRKELFKVKRAIRALMSPAYQKARTKDALLPSVEDRVSAENVFKLLPMSMLALRVSKVDGDPGHGQPGHQHGAKKQKSAQKGGVWTVKVEPQQDARDDMHYVWFYEGSQWKQKAYALLALIAVVTIVLFPLWPYFLRRGVWYLSMGCLGLLAAFFGLAIVRLILFIITVAIGPQPGIWLYPNLFEDVGFFDSFKPVWAWRETKESLAAKKQEKKAKKAARLARREEKANGGTPKKGAAAAAPQPIESHAPAQAGAESTAVEASSGTVEKRNLQAQVEEADDE